MRIYATRFAVAATSLLALVSCVKQQDALTANEQSSFQGGRAIFNQCQVSVGFSGPARKITDNELSELDMMKNDFFKWEATGLAYSQYRLVEAGLCLCRDSEFTDNEVLMGIGKVMGMPKHVNILSLDVDFSRKSLQVDQTNLVGGKIITERVRFHYPTASKACMFMQSTKFDHTTESKAVAFLDTGRSAFEAMPANRPKTMVTNRLEELKSLLDRGILTKDEYTKKRASIIDEM